MDRGLYSAASGGLLNTRRLDVVAHNLANASTVGYKAVRIVGEEQSFSDTLAGTLTKTPVRAPADHERTPGVVNVETVTDFSVGPIDTTGNPLHVALTRQNHFFVVDTPDGEAYTRAGNFSLNAVGTLVTADGLPVLGDGGPITLPEGQVRISGNGTVSVNGVTTGRLQVVQVDDLESLKRTEGVRFALTGGPRPQAVEAEVVPGALEMPNINIVEAMVELIGAQRSFEAYTKTIRSIDELNELAIRNAQTTG